MKIFTHKNARFTVIENGLVRMEYAKDGKFCDRPTLFAARDYSTKKEDFTEAEATERDGAFILETPLMTLTYRENGRAFNRRNLTGRLKIGEKTVYWYPALRNRENLGGALSTLDGVSGEVPLPEGLIARDGWHMIDDSGASVLTDNWIAEGDDDHLSDIYLFVYGHDYKGALKSLAALSGNVALPRKYSFGSWYSRWHPYTSDDFRQIIKEYRENDFPLDILVIDMDWHHHDWQTPKGDPRRTSYGYGHAGGNMGWTGYSWNERLIPDPAGLIKDIKDSGVAVTLNDHPADGIRSNEECYDAFAEKMGLCRGKNIPFLCGDKKYMDAFFSAALAPNEKLGVDFWWIDWQQDYVIPTVPGMKKQKVLPWLNRLYYDHSRGNKKRGQIYSRWGGIGDQRHPMFFSGDTVATWEALKLEIEMTVASGNSLCFFWGHDIGGFSALNGERDSEMFVRWVQFGAISAALKLHSCGDSLDRRPWTWEAPATHAMREMFHLRSRLFPFIYSAAYLSCRDTVPFIKPLYYEYPECEEAYKYKGEFLIGGTLASPIFEKGTGGDKWYTSTVRSEVFLPEGVWYNFFTGEKREGTFTEVCDIHSFPFYVKAGFPLPMQPLKSPMSGGDLSDLIVRLYLPEDNARETFFLYEDDGVSDKYLDGEYLLTEMVCERKENHVTLSLTPSGKGFEGMRAERRITVELMGADNISTNLLYEKKDGAIRIFKDAVTTENCLIEFDLEV